MRPNQTMKQRKFGFIYTFLLIAAISVSTFAATNDAIVGQWRGTFQTPGPTGALELVLTNAENKWSGEVKIEGPGHKILTKSAQKIKVEGENLTFMIEIVGAEMTFTGKLKDGKLTGELEAVENGKTVAMGSWELIRSEK
jgi:hypothetical protein